MHTRVHRHPPMPLPTRALARARTALQWWGCLLQGLRRWREVARQRRALLELDDHLLKDIGLRREDARREAERMLQEELLSLRVVWKDD